MGQQDDIRHNIAVHDRVCRRYEAIHGEIFDPVEQDRLRAKLVQAVALIASGSTRNNALDFGCGTGNLTRHLLELGLQVTAADVSPRSLQRVSQLRGQGGPPAVMQLNGRDLSGIADEQFDLAAAYSVLHHVPDYLAAVAELARVVRPGGVVYIDHERSRWFWEASREYALYVREAAPLSYRLFGPEGWGKFLRPRNYAVKFLRLFQPRLSTEGDLHVWPDDHVEWDRVESVLASAGCEILLKEDYLLFRRGFRQDVCRRYQSRCADMCLLAARKRR
jgi:ubiquinone/menaquinone biosynthesis C-methylase UbiE